MFLEWVRFGFAAFFLLSGMICAVIAVLGIFRFRYVLNRMHAAAMCDTLSVLFILFGIIIVFGFSFISLKLLLVILFFWLASPVSSHLISNLVVATDEEARTQYHILPLPDGSEEGKPH